MIIVKYTIKVLYLKLNDLNLTTFGLLYKYHIKHFKQSLMFLITTMDILSFSNFKNFQHFYSDIHLNDSVYLYKIYQIFEEILPYVYFDISSFEIHI